MSPIARRIASLGLYDVDARAWVTAVRAAGASVSQSRAEKVSALVIALKAAGIWPSLDRLWLHAAENATQALIDLKARATATAVNAPTFSPNKGYTGDGSTSYLNLGLASNAAGINYSRDDAGVGGWMLTAPVNIGGVDWGYDYGGYSMLQARYSATQYRWEINSGTNPSGTPASGGLSTGFFHSQRTGASASTMFRNGVSTITSTAPSVALQAKNFGAGAYVAGPANFSSGQYAASFIGASLSGKELAFYNAMNAFMVAAQVTSYDADTLAWQAAVIAAGGTVSAARRDLVDTYVQTLKSAGVWAQTDDIWLLAAENATQALVSLKQRRTATVGNAPTFTANRGYTFDGAANYLNTGFTPGTHALAATGTNLRVGAYLRTNYGGAACPIGAVNFSTQIAAIFPRSSSDTFVVQLNSQSSGVGGATITDSRGYSVGSRNGTTAGDIVAYKNGVPVTPVTPGSLGSTLPTQPIFIGAYCNNSGVASNFWPGSIGQCVFGASLSPAQEVAAYNALQSLMTSIGANV